MRGDNLARRRGNASKWTRALAGAFLAFLTAFFLGACVHWQVSREIAFASLHAIEQT